MKKKNRYKIIYMYLLCVLLFGVSHQVYAQETGSIQLEVYADNNGDSYTLSNTKFVMYQVGIYENGTWVLQDNFKESGVTFDFEDSSIQGSDAKALEEYARKNQIEGITETANSKGEIRFDNLEQGIYLFVQPEKTYVDNQAYQSEPFIVSVPEYYEGQILWNVIVKPKFKNESIPAIITRTPLPDEKTPLNDAKRSKVLSERSYTGKAKTGDNTEILPWIWLMGASAIILLVYTNKRKNEN